MTAKLAAATVDIWLLPRRDDLVAVLANYLDCSADAIELHREPKGKPFVAGYPLHFNLSHAGNQTLVAVASAPVGIDIERTDRSAEQIAGLLRYFTAAEQAAAAAATIADRAAKTIQVWTRKEAFAKASGRGLGYYFAEASSDANRSPPTATLTDWQVHDVAAPRGYAAAIAAPLGFAVRRMGVWGMAEAG